MRGGPFEYSWKHWLKAQRERTTDARSCCVPCVPWVTVAKLPVGSLFSEVLWPLCEVDPSQAERAVSWARQCPCPLTARAAALTAVRQYAELDFDVYCHVHDLCFKSGAGATARFLFPL